MGKCEICSGLMDRCYDWRGKTCCECGWHCYIEVNGGKPGNFGDGSYSNKPTCRRFNIPSRMPGDKKVCPAFVPREVEVEDVP